MANTFTLKSHSYDGRYLELTCSQTTDIATNTSTISWTLSAVGGNSSFYSTGPTTVLINGEQVYYAGRTSYTTKKFPAAKGSTNGTLEVKHSDNGSKTIAVSLSTDIYNSNVKTVSGNWTLDTIPRAAQITRVSSFDDERNPVIYYSNPLGAAATLNAYIYPQGNSSTPLAGPFLISATGSSATLELTDAQKTALYRIVPSGKDNVKVSFKIKTTYMLSSYWSDDYIHTFTIVPGEPELALVSFTDENETTNFLTDGASIVKGHSDMRVIFNATPQKEATIVSYQVSNNGFTKTGNDATFIDVEDGVFYCSATDSHGFTSTVEISKPVTNYVNLTCHQEAEIELVGETGAKITLTISGNYSSTDFGEEQNFLDLYYRITDDNGEWLEWTYIREQSTLNEENNTYSLTLPITGLSYDKSYKVQSKASDWLIRNIETSDITLSLIPVFDWSETDFNFNVPVKFQGQEMADMVVEQGKSGIWTYRLWQSGIAECWGTVAPAAHSITSAWGSIYTKDNAISQQNYPFQFVEDPVVSMTLHNPTGNCWAFTGTPGGVSKSPAFGLARGASGSVTVGARLMAIGRWK